VIVMLSHYTPCYFHK